MQTQPRGVFDLWPKRNWLPSCAGWTTGDRGDVELSNFFFSLLHFSFLLLDLSRPLSGPWSTTDFKLPDPTSTLQGKDNVLDLAEQGGDEFTRGDFDTINFLTFGLGRKLVSAVDLHLGDSRGGHDTIRLWLLTWSTARVKSNVGIHRTQDGLRKDHTTTVQGVWYLVYTHDEVEKQKASNQHHAF